MMIMECHLWQCTGSTASTIWSVDARDIADPWYTGDFDVTYDDVKEGCEAFLQYLMENEPLY